MLLLGNTSRNRKDNDLLIALSYTADLLCFNIRGIHRKKSDKTSSFTENNLYAGDSRRTSSVCHPCPKVQDFPWHLDKVQV